MPELFESLVAGKHERAGRLPVFAPFDGALIAEVETVGESGPGQALETAYRLFRDRRRWLALEHRIEILERTVDILRKQAEMLALEAAREGASR